MDGTRYRVCCPQQRHFHRPGLPRTREALSRDPGGEQPNRDGDCKPRWGLCGGGDDRNWRRLSLGHIRCWRGDGKVRAARVRQTREIVGTRGTQIPRFKLKERATIPVRVTHLTGRAVDGGHEKLICQAARLLDLQVARVRSDTKQNRTDRTEGRRINPRKDAQASYSGRTRPDHDRHLLTRYLLK
jgi:hypothetical protein